MWDACRSLITYFTAGPKEARATRAETIAYGDYVALNDEAGVRDAGKLRLEGKDYVVADGDVMHFRFAN